MWPDSKNLLRLKLAKVGNSFLETKEMVQAEILGEPSAENSIADVEKLKNEMVADHAAIAMASDANLETKSPAEPETPNPQQAILQNQAEQALEKMKTEAQNVAQQTVDAAQSAARAITEAANQAVQQQKQQPNTNTHDSPQKGKTEYITVALNDDQDRDNYNYAQLVIPCCCDECWF